MATETVNLGRSLGDTGPGVLMPDGVIYHGTVWNDGEDIFVLYQNRKVPVWLKPHRDGERYWVVDV